MVAGNLLPTYAQDPSIASGNSVLRDERLGNRPLHFWASSSITSNSSSKTLKFWSILEVDSDHKPLFGIL